jgi:hypothetical protein
VSGDPVAAAGLLLLVEAGAELLELTLELAAGLLVLLVLFALLHPARAAATTITSPVTGIVNFIVPPR